MNDFLKGKRILFISPIFYDYHCIIQSRLIALGAQVVFFPERKYNWVYSFCRFFSKRLLRIYQERHYCSILEEIDTMSFDYLFVIKGSEMPHSFVSRIKQNSQNIRTILYQWDSLATINYSALVPLFDKVFSFDFEDAQSVKGINYLTLFCSEDLLSADKNVKPEFDLFYVSAYSRERYLDLLKIVKLSSDLRLELFYKLIIPPRQYYKEKYLFFRSIDYKMLDFKPLTRAEYLSCFFRSKIIIDSSHSTQSGLTMRAIETLATGKKLISNNIRIKQINSKQPNICEIGIGKDQIEQLLKINPENVVDYSFSLENWLITLFK